MNNMISLTESSTPRTTWINPDLNICIVKEDSEVKLQNEKSGKQSLLQIRARQVEELRKENAQLREQFPNFLFFLAVLSEDLSNICP